MSEKSTNETKTCLGCYYDDECHPHTTFSTKVCSQYKDRIPCPYNHNTENKTCPSKAKCDLGIKTSCKIYEELASKIMEKVCFLVTDQPFDQIFGGNIQTMPNPENKLYINHKDGNSSNNQTDNLEQVTPSENEHHRFDVFKHEEFLHAWTYQCSEWKSETSYCGDCPCQAMYPFKQGKPTTGKEEQSLYCRYDNTKTKKFIRIKEQEVKSSMENTQKEQENLTIDNEQRYCEHCGSEITATTNLKNELVGVRKSEESLIKELNRVVSESEKKIKFLTTDRAWYFDSALTSNAQLIDMKQQHQKMDDTIQNLKVTIAKLKAKNIPRECKRCYKKSALSLEDWPCFYWCGFCTYLKPENHQSLRQLQQLYKCLVKQNRLKDEWEVLLKGSRQRQIDDLLSKEIMWLGSLKKIEI
jgi:hypothetical protein